LRHNHISI